MEQDNTLKNLIAVLSEFRTKEEIAEIFFEIIHCDNCGSQRCEGVYSEWFSGCQHKEEYDRLVNLLQNA